MAPGKSRPKAKPNIQDSVPTFELLDSAAQGILVADSSGKIIWANAMSAEMFGYTSSEIATLAIEDLLPDTLREKHRFHRYAYSSAPKKRPMGMGIDLSGRHKCGTVFPIEVSLSHIRTESGLLGVAFVSDISQRKRLEESVAAERDRYKALAGRILDAQDQDRRHLSREIHDALGQQLTALKFNLQQMIGKSETLAPELRAASSSIDHLISQLRDIAAHLRPPVLDHLALPEAIEWLVGEFGGSTGIPCNARIQGSLPAVTDEMKLAIFRVCQEALTNVQRHSGASAVTVSLSMRNSDLVVTIADNGLGFAGGVNRNGSLGLLGMRERAESIGGSLDVESAPGEGTKIHVTAPLNHHLPEPEC